MIKTLEVVMAVMILLIFVITLFSGYTKSYVVESISVEKTSEAIGLKAQEDYFRYLVYTDNGEAVYNSLYGYVDSNFSIYICDYLENKEQCVEYGDQTPSKATLFTVNYYFYTINKTLNVLIWS